MIRFCKLLARLARGKKTRGCQHVAPRGLTPNDKVLRLHLGWSKVAALRINRRVRKGMGCFDGKIFVQYDEWWGFGNIMLISLIASLKSTLYEGPLSKNIGTKLFYSTHITRNFPSPPSVNDPKFGIPHLTTSFLNDPFKMESNLFASVGQSYSWTRTKP